MGEHLADLLAAAVAAGQLPGAVGLVDRRGEVELAAVGSHDLDGNAPMTRDSVFRIASATKPITAAALMLLVEEGRVGFEDPVSRWLPELADPVVVRTPSSPLDDVVPARRPIAVWDLLTSRAGYGFGPDFALPQVAALFAGVQRDGRYCQTYAEPDTWMAELAAIPLLHQPGEAWLYNTCSDLQGVLVARAAHEPLPDFLAERVFAPLGMADTAFALGPEQRSRMTSLYRNFPDGLELDDPPDGRWSIAPAFASGASGLLSTVDDWLAFGRMLLARGRAADGTPLLSEQSVRLMTTDHLTADQRAAGELFLEGQGWGFGGSVDVQVRRPGEVPGRYGWTGGTGVLAHVTPATGTVAVLMTQLSMDGPTSTPLFHDFTALAASAP